MLFYAILSTWQESISSSSKRGGWLRPFTLTQLLFNGSHDSKTSCCEVLQVPPRAAEKGCLREGWDKVFVKLWLLNWTALIQEE